MEKKVLDFLETGLLDKYLIGSTTDVETIIVEHKDRLMLFGFEYVESTLKSRGAKVIVVDDSESRDDLVQDMISVLTSFCARLYGKRLAKNKAKRIVMECEKESGA